MDLRKHDSTQIGLMNLFFHDWKIRIQSEKNIQNLGKRLNSYHKTPETLEKKQTKFKEPSQSSSNTKDHAEG